MVTHSVAQYCSGKRHIQTSLQPLQNVIVRSSSSPRGFPAMTAKEDAF